MKILKTNGKIESLRRETEETNQKKMLEPKRYSDQKKKKKSYWMGSLNELQDINIII